MKIKIEDLKKSMMGIYKITFPNNKIYIGLSNDIRRRMWEHNNEKKAKTPCDYAIVKYGKVEEIEIIEFVNNPALLEQRERHWIKYYKSNDRDIGYNLTEGGDATGNYGENNYKAVFTSEEVLDIRRRRYNGERKIDVYSNLYSNYSFGTFERIWLGNGYPGVGEEYKVEVKTRQEYSSIANSGENNNKAKLNKEIVLDIRKRYDGGESPISIQKLYSFVSIESIRRVCKRQTWKSV